MGTIATYARGQKLVNVKNLFACALVFQNFLRLLVEHLLVYNSLLLLDHLFKKQELYQHVLVYLESNHPLMHR